MQSFELKWDKHETSICKGLTSLQQNGEFVDMTIAADGCFVKVHQIVMSLASPYIKKLISSAPSPYPVLFLNNITASTLGSILEYIYTGEVIVNTNCLRELFEAGENLQIIGLKDLTLGTTKELSNAGDVIIDFSNQSGPNKVESAEADYLQDDDISDPCDNYSEPNEKTPDNLTNDVESLVQEPAYTECNEEEVKKCIQNKCDSAIQYTVSNQGSLQLILNRYIYYLKYSNKTKNMRQWRCINYTFKKNRCPAYVVTSDDMVIQRSNTHTHAYHDKQVLKKCRLGQIFSTTTSAEKEKRNFNKSLT